MRNVVDFAKKSLPRNPLVGQLYMIDEAFEWLLGIPGESHYISLHLTTSHYVQPTTKLPLDHWNLNGNRPY